MVRYIKSYSEKDKVKIEVAVTAFTGNVAKIRGAVSVFGRRPGQLTGLESVESFMLRDDGIVNEHRVVITITPNESLRDKAKITAVAEKIEELL